MPRAGGELDTGPCFYAPHLLARPDRVLMWAWAWELGRAPAQVAAAGWAGSLTFPREVFLPGDGVSTRPVPELTGLRTDPLPTGTPFDADSFDAVLPASDNASLTLIDDGAERTVIDLAPGGGRILVDGSMVEAFDGSGGAHTTRACPTATSRWLIRADAPARAWRTA